MRAAIRRSGTNGVARCFVPRCAVPADDGTEWDGLPRQVDHIEDECAYLVVVRYVIDADGKLHLDKPVSDERMLERP